MADIGPATAFTLAFGSPEPPHPSGVRRTTQHAQAPIIPTDRYTSGHARRRIAQHAQGGSPTPPPVLRYGMRGRDPDCLTLTYRSWVATGEADYAGAQYAGARCGGTPLADVVVLWVGT